MAKKTKAKEVITLEPAIPEHDHPLLKHDHPLPEHSHPLPEHDHPLPEHQHLDVPTHDHRDLRGHLRGAVRALLTVFETGSLNTEQRKAIHAVRVIMGDAYGLGCAHELAVYEEGDRLICQDCREDITPVKADAGG